MPVVVFLGGVVSDPRGGSRRLTRPRTRRNGQRRRSRQFLSIGIAALLGDLDVVGDVAF